MINTTRKNVLIIGSGVIGLSVAIKLLEQHQNNISITIFTSKRTPHTTSDIAGALWGPYKIEPQNKANQFAIDSLNMFDKISKEEKNSGVYYVNGERFGDEGKPTWIEGNEVFFQYRRWDNWIFYRVPMCDMKLYMPYLERKFYELGGECIIQKHLNSLNDISEFERMHGKQFDLIINCTGMGSRKLFNDQNMLALQGQILHVQLPSTKLDVHGSDKLEGKFYLSLPSDPNDTNSTYILPRTNNIYVLGGTSDFIDPATMDEENPRICPDTSVAILQRCHDLVPHANLIENAKVLKHIVGWRPFRKNGFRIELSTMDEQRPILHAYGFGGCGVTLSWVSTN
jgi:D-amino-acid oxidase